MALLPPPPPRKAATLLMNLGSGTKQTFAFCFPSRAQTEFRSRNILFTSKPNPHKQYLPAQLEQQQIFSYVTATSTPNPVSQQAGRRPRQRGGEGGGCSKGKYHQLTIAGKGFSKTFSAHVAMQNLLPSSQPNPLGLLLVHEYQFYYP